MFRSIVLFYEPLFFKIADRPKHVGIFKQIYLCKLLGVKLLKELFIACYECYSQFLVWEVNKITKCNNADDSVLEDSSSRLPEWE